MSNASRLRQWNLVPANGRDYRTPVELRRDFEMGRDFLIADMSDPYDGKPVNRASMSFGDSVRVRYARLTKICMFMVTEAGQWKLADALTKTQKAAITSSGAPASGILGGTGANLRRLGLLDPRGMLTQEGYAVRNELLNHINRASRLEGES